MTLTESPAIDRNTNEAQTPIPCGIVIPEGPDA